MRTFAEKPKATQQAMSPKTTAPARSYLGHSHEVNSILHLQRTIGNQAVQRLLQSNAEESNTILTGTTSPHFGHDFSRIPIHPPVAGAIQTKLVVNKLGDEYEQEADRVAEQVMHMPETRLQRAWPTRLGTLGVQAKLKIGAPNDAYEQEADRVAEQVMRMTEPKVQKTSQANTNSKGIHTRLSASKADVPIQRQEEPEQEDERGVQIKLRANNLPQRQQETDFDEDEDFLQAKATLGYTPQVIPNVADNIQNLRNGGQPLPPNQRHFFESRMGHDFSGVRIHTDANAIQASRSIQARAFTIGNHIAFNSGQYSPTSQTGKHLLAHELAHTIQQSGSGSIRDKRIQRAMKYEYQIKRNRLLLDSGNSIIPLPRKFGPEDYLVKKASGARLESETHGQPEFETGWERNWTKLGAQISDAAQMAADMKGAASVTRDGKTYKEFPFASEIDHLFRGSHYRTGTIPKKGKGLWLQSQATGKYKVKRNRAPVKAKRSSRSATKARLDKGTKVTVSKSRKGWRYIAKGDIEGWVKRPHLAKEYKRYESNETKDSAGNKIYIDKPLTSGSKLLVDDSRNPSWKAYIQTSESFELGQFGSFFLSSTARFKGKSWKTETEDTARDLIKRGSSRELQSFVLLVVNYIKMARGEGPYGTVGKGKSVKYAFPVMSRTDIGSLYKSMSKPDREELDRLVADKDDGILAKMGLDGSEKLFEKRYPKGKKQRYEPLTVKNWLQKITGGKDLLRGRGFPAAMGRFKIEDEKGKHKGLMRAENRKGNKSLPPDKWKSEAMKQFFHAKALRYRDSGKGKTGLKWK